MAHILHDAQENLRNALAAVHHDIRADDQHQHGSQAKPDRLASLAVLSRNILAGLLDQLKDLPCTLVQEQPSRRRFHAARVSNQQGDSEVFLELAKLHAKRRLRDEQAIGSPSHVSELDDPHKVAQLPQVHSEVARTIPSTGSRPNCTAAAILQLRLPSWGRTERFGPGSAPWYGVPAG